MKKAVLGITASAILLSACASDPHLWTRTASAVLEPRSGSSVHGVVNFLQVGNRVHITGNVWGHSPGPKGFHIHENGDCSDAQAMKAGGHFNPEGRRHGAPGAGHAGDLGNLVFDANGRAKIDIMTSAFTVDKDMMGSNVIGRSVVIHAAPDDLKTDPTGNAGGRVACGVIGAPSGLTY